MTQPRILAVGEEPPPMDDGEPRPERNGQRHDRAKGKSGSAKRRIGERFALLNAFVDFTMADLKPSERAVWLVLFRDTKSDGIARTSERDLARRAGITDRMVRYALTALEQRGLLRIVRRGRLQIGPSSYRALGWRNSALEEMGFRLLAEMGFRLLAEMALLELRKWVSSIP